MLLRLTNNARLSRRFLSSVQGIKWQDYNTLKDYAVAVLKTCDKSKVPWTQMISNFNRTLPMSDKHYIIIKTDDQAYIDSVILQAIHSLQDPLLLLRYVQYVGSDRKLPSPVTRGILKIWNRLELQSLSQDDKKHVRDFVHQALKENPNMSEFNSGAVGVLSLCGYFDEAHEILRKENDLNPQFLKTFLKVAIKENRLDAFWDAADTKFIRTSNVSKVSDQENKNAEYFDEVYCTFIEELHENHAEMEKLFTHFRQQCVMISPKVVKTLQRYYSGKVVDRRGYCSACKEKLPAHFSVSKDDCQRLKNTMHERVIMKHDSMYVATTPEEYQRFQNYLDDLDSKGTKCDIVVDGLNMAFLNAQKIVKNSVENDTTNTLLIGLKELKNKGFKNIILVHRHWLKNTRLARQILDICESILLLDRLSADDPFAIMLALHFGPGTYLASNDVFRGYYQNLNDIKLQNLFMRWQLQHIVNYTGAPVIDRSKDSFDKTITRIKVRFFHFSAKLQGVKKHSRQNGCRGHNDSHHDFWLWHQ